MRSLLIILLAAATTNAAPITSLKAPKLGKSVIVAPVTGPLLSAPLFLSLSPVLPTLHTTPLVLPNDTSIRPSRILRRAVSRAVKISATQPRRREPLLQRLTRGFKGALSLPSIYDNTAAPAFNGADNTPAFRLRTKPDRRSPRIAERAARELKLDAEKLYVTLREIHDISVRQGDAGLRDRKLALLQRLDTAARNVPAAPVVQEPYQAASNQLKDLHKQRDMLIDAQGQAAAAQNGAKLDALNEAAIELHRSILKAQFGVSTLLLTGKSRLNSKPMRRNAGIWTLGGAFNSASALEAEVRYHTNRHRLREKRSEYLTQDAFGRPVRVFNLEGFDIEVFPPIDGGKAIVTIRQQRWRNVLTNLRDAARDSRAGRHDAASNRLDTIVGIYTVAETSVEPEIRRDYKRIAHALNEAREAVANRQENASDLIEAIGEMLSYPQLSTWEDVAYHGMEKALSSQAHTLIGNLNESVRVLRHLSELEYWQDLLNAALRPEQGGVGRPLSKRERTRIRGGMDSILSWAKRGKVRPKQETAIALETAATAMEREDFVMARERIKRAHTALQRRLKDLDSISAHVRNRAASLYAQYEATQSNP